MPAVLKHITHSMPTHVPILDGAAEELVTRRELRNKYETNRDIKTWACWFLLKALTTSGKIQSWQKQIPFLCKWTQTSEKTLRWRLEEMEKLKIVTIEQNTIHLISYEKAAAVLDIAYTGLIRLEYNPDKYGGKQVFQYLIRGEEFRYQQERQLSALLYKMDNNPLLKNDLHLLLVKAGADDQKLRMDGCYYQEKLLQLQMRLFKEGSDILDYVMTHRADINRGVVRIQKNHGYKAKQSVSYLKKRMQKLNVITITKWSVKSEARSRIYIPDAGARGGKRDGYKWFGKEGKTVRFLTDQIQFNYSTLPQNETGRSNSKAA